MFPPCLVQPCSTLPAVLVVALKMNIMIEIKRRQGIYALLQYTSCGSNSAKSTDPDSIGGIRYAAKSSDTSAATNGILFKFFTTGMSLLSPTAIIFWFISTIRSNFRLNSGFSTSRTAGKIRAVVRFVCKNNAEMKLE